MYAGCTTVGFFDSMGPPAVDFILKQTELKTLFCTNEYIEKIVSMRRDGHATSLTHVVSFDGSKIGQATSLSEKGITLLSYADVIAAGKTSDEALPGCKADDCPIFSYTSGTTGDSKGVKLSHKNLLATASAA